MEEEEVDESYCSSDDEIDVRLSPRAASHPDTLSGRMKRILLWREQSPQLLSGWSTLDLIIIKLNSLIYISTDSISLKRRLYEIAENALDNDDNVYHLFYPQKHSFF